MSWYYRYPPLLLASIAALNFGFFVTNQSKSCSELLQAAWDFSPPSERKVAVSRVDYRIAPVSCRQVPKIFQSLQEPWEINELRRNISLTDLSCFQKHQDLFVPQFLERLRSKQYNLHIPKTGGTSLCKLVKENKLTTGERLCRHKGFCPFWCNMCNKKIGNLKYQTCDNVRESKYQFVGNERWMDFDETRTNVLWCKDYAYSLSIREPVARALSNTNMWFERCYRKPTFTAEQRTERLNIVQSNYMVWSLVSGMAKDPKEFKPLPEHVPLAKRTLAKFDYIVEVSNPDICNEDVYRFMGLAKTAIPTANTAKVENYTDAYHKESYKLMNALDTDLYHFARDIMKVDCLFYGHVKQNYELPKLVLPKSNGEKKNRKKKRKRVYEKAKDLKERMKNKKKKEKSRRSYYYSEYSDVSEDDQSKQ